MLDEPTELLLAAAQAKIRAGEEPSEDEMRAIILSARAGRRSAAEGQRKTRAGKPAPISVSTLFPTLR